MPTWDERIEVVVADAEHSSSDDEDSKSDNGGIEIRKDGDSRIAIDVTDTANTENITVLVPQKLNLSIRGNICKVVDVHDKIEGDVTVQLDKGDISVNKIRGENICLQTGSGSLLVKSVVEGSSLLIADEVSVLYILLCCSIAQESTAVLN